MRRFIRSILALALLVAAAQTSRAENGGETARAEEVLKQARTALGGDEKIRAVGALTVKGKYRRVVQEREIAGEREFNILLPDKFLRTDWFASPMGPSVATYRGLNGDQTWSGNSGGGGGMIIMRADGGNLTKEQMEKAQKQFASQMRAELARYLIALLLTPPAGFDVAFTYAGEAVADDGRADVIDASGPDGFAARLFLDKETHLPLMLTYRAPKPRVVMMRTHADGKKKPEERIKEAQEQAQKEAAAGARPEEAEMQLRFADYREAGGLRLPHRVTQAIDGEVSEEWEIKTYEINPQFKADKFQKK